MIVVIVANGAFDQSTAFTNLVKQADMVIAVDGGANHCQRMGLTPALLVGDFDSIDPSLLRHYKEKDIPIHRHPTSKDATDLELALDLAVQKGAGTIWLVAALGGRWDMSLSTVMLAAADKYKKQNIFLLAQDSSMQILRPEKTYTISGTPGQTVSFLPLKNDVHGVTLTGFEYPLASQSISFGSSLGVSNVLNKSSASVQFREGLLLCISFPHSDTALLF